MGGIDRRSSISAHFRISRYFFTAKTYKRVLLTNRVYGMWFTHIHVTTAKTKDAQQYSTDHM